MIFFTNLTHLSQFWHYSWFLPIIVPFFRALLSYVSSSYCLVVLLYIYLLVCSHVLDPRYEQSIFSCFVLFCCINLYWIIIITFIQNWYLKHSIHVIGPLLLYLSVYYQDFSIYLHRFAISIWSFAEYGVLLRQIVYF